MRIMLALLFVAPLIPLAALLMGLTTVTPFLVGAALVAIAAQILIERRTQA